MGRNRSTPGGRPVAVATKLSAVEVAAVDEIRGGVRRADYLRDLVLADIRRHAQPDAYTLPGAPVPESEKRATP